MKPLEYNLVDAYERELNDWWYEIPPIIDRFNNVITPYIQNGQRSISDIYRDNLEPGVFLNLMVEL